MAAGVTVMEMNQLGQSSLDYAQSICCHNSSGRESAIGLNVRRWHKTKSSKPKGFEDLLEASISRSPINPRHSRGQLRQGAQRPSQFFCTDLAFVFTVFTDGVDHEGFQFPGHHYTSFRGTKRHRLRSDVDGPNTLEVSRKKRRLHSHLTTSRLSRPFSQPATHILNRQGKQAGDRRFWKMAASVDLSRRAAHIQATSYLRYSVMNRLRKRLGLVKDTTSERHQGQNLVDQDTDTSGKAPWQQQQQATKTNKEANQRLASVARDDAIIPIPPIALPPQPTNMIHTHQVTKPPPCRLSNPVALPLPSADSDVTIDRISSRICPAPSSPEQRPPSAYMYDDHEEDGFAFLHLEYEYAAEEDSAEHVYCDFDTIFGAKSSTPSESQPSEDHTYEEYMDELDGISWRLR